MKKIDFKSNSMTRVVALLLVTCVAIGLVSSTAIKLAASTYYLQNKREFKTNIPVVDKVIDAIVDSNIPFVPDVVVPPATEAPTTAAPSTTAPTTAAPETTAPEASDKTDDTTAGTTAPAGDSSSGGVGDILGSITGMLGGIDIGGMLGGVDIGGMLGGVDIGGMLGGLGGSTEEESTTEPTTESEASKANKKDVLKEYNLVVNYAKTIGKPSFQKITYRSLDKGLVDSFILHSVESAYPDYFVSKDNAAPVVVPQNSATSEFLIDNSYYAGMLAAANAADAIESATSVKLEDGTRKIVITLRQEVDPAVTAPNAKKAASNTSAMFPVITNDIVADKVGSTLKLTSIASSKVTYKDCTVELIYKPGVVNEIQSIKQTTNYVGEIKVDLSLGAKGTVTEVSEYSNFDYGLI